MKDNNKVAHAKVKIENSEYTPENFSGKYGGLVMFTWIHVEAMFNQSFGYKLVNLINVSEKLKCLILTLSAQKTVTQHSKLKMPLPCFQQWGRWTQVTATTTSLWSSPWPAHCLHIYEGCLLYALPLPRTRTIRIYQVRVIYNVKSKVIVYILILIRWGNTI